MTLFLRTHFWTLDRPRPGAIPWSKYPVKNRLSWSKKDQGWRFPKVPSKSGHLGVQKQPQN